MTEERFIKTTIVAAGGGGALALAWAYDGFGLKYFVPGAVALAVLASTLFFRDAKTPFFYLLVIVMPIFAAHYLAPIPPNVQHTGVLNLPVLYSYEIPLYSFLLLWLLEWTGARGSGLRFPRLTAPFALLFLPAVLSTFIALDSSYGLFELLRMFEMFLVFLVVVNYLKTDRQLKIAAAVLGAGIIFQSLLAGVQFLAPGPTYNTLAKFGIYMDLTRARPFDATSPVRVCGTTGYCNALAGFLELTVPLFASLFLFYPMSRVWRRLTGAVVGVALVALTLTYSRGGLLGMLAAGAAFFALAARRFPHLRRRAVRVGLLAVAQGAVLLAFFSGRLLTRLQLFMAGSMEDKVRVALIRDAFLMIKANPLVGVGLNNYPEAFTLYGVSGIKFVYLYPVHNTWLLIAAEQGLIGLVFFCLFVGFVFADGWRAVRETSPFAAAAGLGLTAGLLGWLTHNLVAPLYQNWLVNRITFVFVVGVLAALPRLVHDADAKTEADETGPARPEDAVRRGRPTPLNRGAPAAEASGAGFAFPTPATSFSIIPRGAAAQ